MTIYLVFPFYANQDSDVYKSNNNCFLMASELMYEARKRTIQELRDEYEEYIQSNPESEVYDDESGEEELSAEEYINEIRDEVIIAQRAAFPENFLSTIDFEITHGVENIIVETDDLEDMQTLLNILYEHIKNESVIKLVIPGYEDYDWYYTRAKEANYPDIMTEDEFKINLSAISYSNILTLYNDDYIENHLDKSKRISFKRAYDILINGGMIRLPWWKGFWKIDNGVINFHDINGLIKPLSDGTLEILKYATYDQWEVMEF